MMKIVNLANLRRIVVLSAQTIIQVHPQLLRNIGLQLMPKLSMLRLLLKLRYQDDIIKNLDEMSILLFHSKPIR